jgi:uncharacterized SAM-dependent methyltransferase
MFRQITEIDTSEVINFSEQQIDLFLTQLSDMCRTGDMILIGFDLKKSPGIIMKAYDDPYGLVLPCMVSALLNISLIKKTGSQIHSG